MCKLSAVAVPNNFKRSAAPHRFFNSHDEKTSANQKSTNILLGSEPETSRFEQPTNTSPNVTKPPAGVAKRASVDQKGASISFGTEKSSARFVTPPKPKSAAARPAGSTKKMKKPAHFIDTPASGLSLGSDQPSARFAPQRTETRPANSFHEKNIAAGSAKASGRTRQSDSAVALGAERNARSRFAHKEAARAPVPAKKPAATAIPAGAPIEYGKSKCDAKPSIRATRKITAGTYAFSGGVADAPRRRERRTHTSSMSFQDGGFAGDVANSAKQPRPRSSSGKGHSSSIAFEGGVTSAEGAGGAQRAQQRQRPAHGAAQHKSSLTFRANSMGGDGAASADPKQRVCRREEHNSTLSLGSDAVRYASTSIASAPARRGVPLRHHRQAPAGGRPKSAPVALTDKAPAPAAARTNRCPQNYGRSQIFF